MAGEVEVQSPWRTSSPARVARAGGGRSASSCRPATSSRDLLTKADNSEKLESLLEQVLQNPGQLDELSKRTGRLRA